MLDANKKTRGVADRPIFAFLLDKGHEFNRAYVHQSSKKRDFGMSGLRFFFTHFCFSHKVPVQNWVILMSQQNWVIFCLSKIGSFLAPVKSGHLL